MDIESLKLVSKTHDYADSFIKLSHASAIAANSYIRAALFIHMHAVSGTPDALHVMRAALIECDMNEKKVASLIEELKQKSHL